jgi:hypothetical protein
VHKEAIMKLAITDPKLLEALKTDGSIDLTDAEGRHIGTYFSKELGKPPAGFVSKFSEEYLEEIRRDGDEGVTTEELLKELKELEASL